MGDLAYVTFAAVLVALPIMGMAAAWSFAMNRLAGKTWRTRLFVVGMLLATYTVTAPILILLLAVFGVYNEGTLSAGSIAALDRGLLVPGLLAFPLLVLGAGKARWFGIASSLIADAVASFFILGATYKA